MDELPKSGTRIERYGLWFILGFAFVTRIVDVNLPLIDGMPIKQIYVAQRARQIAGPPFDLLNNNFDFMTEDGTPLNLTEEVPLYPGIVAAGYRVFGEQEWLGRLLSILATLVGIAALYDLVRAEMGNRLGLVAALMYSLTPLLQLYGRAFQADACMVACMLTAACCYRRFLDRPHWTWWLLTAGVGLVGAMFKYYALMVLLPLACMTYQRRGWRGWLSWQWIGLGIVMVSPIAAWMGGFFATNHNPAKFGKYFIHQMPELIVQETLYLRFVDRFLYKDCGPVLTLMMGLGVWTAIRKSTRSITLVGWTAMGLLFFVLMGPLLRCHNYYELMLLPAASIWGAIGWTFAFSRERVNSMGWGVLIAMALVQSPLVMNGVFVKEHGVPIVAERLQHYCSPHGRFVVAGPGTGVGFVHYSHRQGWMWVGPPPNDWVTRIENYRRLGAECLLVYFNREVSSQEREAYQPILSRWPVLEKGSGPWDNRRGRVDYWILDLQVTAPKTLPTDLTRGRP